MDRRAFLASLLAAGAVREIRAFDTSSDVHLSIVPAEPCSAPNYWCTWSVQNYMYGQNQRTLDIAQLEGDAGAQLARNAMSEANLFGARGWARSFHSRIRKDIFLLLDDGWESGGSATFLLDNMKFPSFPGPLEERLRRLNYAVKEAGWRGTALWCRNTPSGEAGLLLEQMSQHAQIPYWKIDLGDPQFDLIQQRNRGEIPLTLEHVHGESPVNGNWSKDGRFGAQSWDSKRVSILRNTDVYRSYDVTSVLSFPTTLDRAAELLSATAEHSDVKSLLNLEDEVYLAAVLGCTMGVMRHPLIGLRPGEDADLFFNGPRNPKKRMDEVVRAVRWQRIAPPFPTGAGFVRVDNEILTDSWVFAKGQTWDSSLIGKHVHQGAPARVSRNIELPRVTAPVEKPYVFAARFPNGAVAIGASERTRPESAWYMPACDVELHVGDAPGPFGIFGEFRKLTLTFDRTISGKKFYAQDLAGDMAIEIGGMVEREGACLRIDGALLRRIGLSSGAPGDLSSPAIVLAIR